MKEFLLEAFLDSLASAEAAKQGGADRLELCTGLVIGGLTPGLSFFRQVKKRTGLRVHVLIRPRFGDFCYSADEFEGMKEDIQAFVQAGADGIVTGFLRPDGHLDFERMRQVRELCGTCHFTLHRAFDVCVEPFRALREAKEIGVDTILTSGQKDSALDGADLLHDLVQAAEGKVDILVGSGVQAKNLAELASRTGAKSFHLSAKKEKDSAMAYRKTDVHMGLPMMSEYTIFETDAQEIAAARRILEQLSGNQL